jgi:hypothetical protein
VASASGTSASADSESQGRTKHAAEMCFKREVNGTARVAFAKMFISHEVMNEWKVDEEALAEAFTLNNIIVGSFDGANQSCSGTINVNMEWFNTRPNPESEKTSLMIMLTAFASKAEGMTLNYAIQRQNESHVFVYVQNPIAFSPVRGVLRCDKCGGW